MSVVRGIFPRTQQLDAYTRLSPQQRREVDILCAMHYAYPHDQNVTLEELDKRRAELAEKAGNDATNDAPGRINLYAEQMGIDPNNPTAYFPKSLRDALKKREQENSAGR